MVLYYITVYRINFEPNKSLPNIRHGGIRDLDWHDTVSGVCKKFQNLLILKSRDAPGSDLPDIRQIQKPVGLLAKNLNVF
jgi:hypothetical protein